MSFTGTLPESEEVSLLNWATVVGGGRRSLARGQAPLGPAGRGGRGLPLRLGRLPWKRRLNAARGQLGAAGGNGLKRGCWR